ncbi:hypothetical protein [Hyphomonas sp.]|uniref:hypothetical protein n=1 Tax=Hyphomonas sp. TaxID=87 RepID=UPI0025B82B57|nr:hypothetical protein [Hyphomonas sp.]
MIAAGSVTPESLDDFALEGGSPTTWVQVKSKIGPYASFRPKEIADVIVGGPGADSDSRWIVLDRPFSGHDSSSTQPRALSTKLQQELAETASTEMRPALVERLGRTRLLILPNPIDVAIDELCAAKDINRLSASVCITELVSRVGQAASANARLAFETRSSLTLASVQNCLDALLAIMGADTVDAAVLSGVVSFIDFGVADPDPEFYLGTSAKPGHVSAGLALPREDDVDAVVVALLRHDNAMICGPSGSGKSALAYLAAFELRHAARLVEISNIEGIEQSSLTTFFLKLAPSPERPVIVYIDDVGKRGSKTWDWLREQARLTPGVKCLGTVREEDLYLIDDRHQLFVFRPVLTEGLAKALWQKLHEQGHSKTAHWREAFEKSGGLLLEYVHIVTQGQHLKEMITDQIDRRLKEHRDDELQLLSLISAAGRCGAGMSIDRLLLELKMDRFSFARANQRLRNEHLVGPSSDQIIRGLHELRSEAILEICLDRLSLAQDQLVFRASGTIVPEDIRRYLTVMGRAGVLSDEAALQAVVQRVSDEPRLDIIIEGLEALRLRTILKDADTFHEVAEDLNFSHREFILCLLVMKDNLAEALGTSAVFKPLRNFHARFKKRREEDHRLKLFDALAADTAENIFCKCASAGDAIRLATALHGAPLKRLSEPALDALIEAMRDAPIKEIAELIAILSEAEMSLGERAADQLGGSDGLLIRLACETPWALLPVLEMTDAGAIEVTANMLSVETYADENLEERVSAYASIALQLCPKAERVNAVAVQASGEGLTINNYTPTEKALPRSAVHSRAETAWNRMMIHAVGQGRGAKTYTEVLERYAFSIEKAAGMLANAVDHVCRRRTFKQEQLREVRALSMLDRLLPSLPLAAPEDQLGDPIGADISDAIGTYVSSLSQFITELMEGNKTGFQLALLAADILKAGETVKADPKWRFLNSAPVAIEQIASTIEAFRPALLAAGRHTLAETSGIIEPRVSLTKGVGLKRLEHRLRKKEALDIANLKRKAKETLDAELFYKPAANSDLLLWPLGDVCIVRPLDSLIDFFHWIDRSLETIEEFADSVCVVAPSINGRILPQLAIRIVRNFPPLPDEEFQTTWHPYITDETFARSQSLDDFRLANHAMVQLYATQNLLDGKNLLEIELNQLNSWLNEAQSALTRLEDRADKGSEGAELAYAELVKLHKKLTDEDGNAVSHARELLGGLTGDLTDAAEHNLVITLTLLADDLHVGIDANDTI